MSSSPNYNRILCIADDEAKQQHLLNRLFRTSATPINEAQLTLPHPYTNVKSTHYTIDIKYYTATLEVVHVANNNDTIWEDAESTRQHPAAAQLRQGLQGVILVYNPEDRSSFDRIQHWRHFIDSCRRSELSDEEQSSETEEKCKAQADQQTEPSSMEEFVDPSVLLLVKYGKLSASEFDEEALDWALDHGFELIPVAHESSSEDEAALKVGTGTQRRSLFDEELTGLPRLIEALQCNPWINRTTKNPPNPTVALAQATFPEEMDEEDEHEHTDVPDSIHPSVTSTSSATISSSTSASSTTPQSSTVTDSTISTTSSAPASTSPSTAADDFAALLKAVDEVGSAAGAEDDEDADALDNNIAAFEALFQKMMSVKQEAVAATQQANGNGTNSNSTLSDAQRRKRAEDAIMSMLATMGLDEDDDEQDVDSDRD